MADRRKSKKKLWLIPVGAGVIAILCCGILVCREIRNRQIFAINENAGEDVYDESEEEPDTVLWNGRKYRYNDHLSNFLFLGVDQREPVETETGHADAGQSDALFLVSWDRVEQRMTVISIPRDTMTDIEVFAYTGESLGTNRNHICLAYAYGDGKYKSLDLTEQAVSHLFYGLPIQGSCSINLDALPLLTESVGGIMVTVPNSSLEEQYPEFREGAEVALTGDNTEAFVRYRDVDVSQSAMTRLERQQVFLEAFEEKAIHTYAENKEFITDLYEDLEPYMVSTIGKDQLVKLMECMAGDNSPVKWTVPGKGTEGLNYDEYIVDDEALYGKIMETFYKVVEE